MHTDCYPVLPDLWRSPFTVGLAGASVRDHCVLVLPIVRPGRQRTVHPGIPERKIKNMPVKILMTRAERAEKLLLSRQPDLIQAVECGEMSIYKALEILNPFGPARAWSAPDEEKITWLREIFPFMNFTCQKG